VSSVGQLVRRAIRVLRSPRRLWARLKRARAVDAKAEAAAQRTWEDAVRRRMELPAGTRLDELGEPQRTWALYARSTVERGRGVIAALAAHGWRPGLRFLDAGCAYGGYLVAAAEGGAAEVVGIDIDDELLGMAKKLLEAYRVPGRLERGSVEDRELLRRLSQPAGFDVVTCTDVLEHVADPQAAMEALAGCLAPGGRAYVAVPNFRCPAWVRSDPHYQILGITLLPPEQAEPAALAIHPWLIHYGVGDYHTLQWYRRQFGGLGLETWLLNPPAGSIAATAGRLCQEARELRAEVARGMDPRLPADLAGALRDAVTAWADELLANLAGERPDSAMIDEYAVQTWEMLVVKPG
jgi:2-polyprenyl-3-methyl-5-hydroxy-6-metoxy-1,4-benzoquinol methylase